MSDDRLKAILKERSKLVAAVQRAAWNVHFITGRTDQHTEDVAAEHPDHDDVKAWRAASEALKKFDEQNQEAT